MARDNSFAEYILKDVLGEIRGISMKGMFGGFGVYLNGVIVGIIYDGNFYLKADKKMMEKYSKESSIFEYERKGSSKIVRLPYISVPSDVLENKQLMQERIFESYELSDKS